jgi:putative membrane protein
MPIGVLLMVAFWGVVIAFGVWLLSRWVRSPDSGVGISRGNGALAVARERYARGEISRDEFERIKRDLSW